MFRFAEPHRLLTPRSNGAVNWMHPLANGLAAAFVPGLTLASLVGDGLVLTPDSSATKLVTGRDGPALLSDATSSGLSATTPARLKSWSTSAYFWMGYFVGTTVDHASICAVLYTDTDSPPYFVMAVTYRPGGNLRYFGNSAGTGVIVEPVARPASWLLSSIGQTNVVGGNLTAYLNGASVGTVASASAPISTSTSKICIGTYYPVQSRYINGVTLCCYFWDRGLAAYEHQLLTRDPFCFLSDDLQPILNTVAGGFKAAWARNSNIVLGARVA